MTEPVMHYSLHIVLYYIAVYYTVLYGAVL